LPSAADDLAGTIHAFGIEFKREPEIRAVQAFASGEESRQGNLLRERAGPC
jgi:hypothetical protein